MPQPDTPQISLPPRLNHWGVYERTDWFDAFLRGMDAYQQRDLPNAIQHYTEAIAEKPQHASSYINRAVCYSELHEYTAALSDFEYGIAQNPECGLAHYNLGNCYYAQQDYPRAIAAFQRALECRLTRLEEAETHNNLGIAYLKYTSFDAALHHYERSIEAYPEYGAPYYNTAICLLIAYAADLMHGNTAALDITYIVGLLDTAVDRDADIVKAFRTAYTSPAHFEATYGITLDPDIIQRLTQEAP